VTISILNGDCREVLRTLPDESVHCVVTSPPYWGLRDYGTAKWEGGDVGCEHVPSADVLERQNGRSSTLVGSTTHQKQAAIARSSCQCGARRIDSQLGLEPTYQEYVANMVEVFREVRRVLRKDGTCWVNMGDSYAANVNGRSAADVKALGNDDRTFRDKPFSTIQGVLKPKDLCGIPWRVAFALQTDGWWLRQDIIWSKPNPMPESVTDRCTKAHEYLFLLSKSERYYYDAEAIAETSIRAGDIPGGSKKVGATPYPFHDRQNLDRAATKAVSETRNKRSVWEIGTAPFPEAHFATFPPALIEPCIKAGTSEKGCCAKCGAPWMRKTEKEFKSLNSKRPNMTGQKFMQGWEGTTNGYTEVKSVGWSASCSCTTADADSEPFPLGQCTVLDPFGGAGTTGLVADRYGRDAILIELNPEYIAMAERRLRDDAGMFAEVVGQ
jgi:DNA modification methylase